MNKILIFAMGFLVAAGPVAVDAKPKGKAKGKGKGIPPGQLRKAEVHDALERGESPSRRYSAPPQRIYRNWERDRIYVWDDRRYHWSDGAWVIVID